MYGVKFVNNNRGEFIKFESTMPHLVLLFNQFHERKCLFACVRRSKTTCNSERIFLWFWDIFTGVRIASQKQKFQKYQELKKAHQISFSILNLFWSQWMPFACHLAFLLSFFHWWEWFHKCENVVFFFSKITKATFQWVLQ